MIFEIYRIPIPANPREKSSTRTRLVRRPMGPLERNLCGTAGTFGLVMASVLGCDALRRRNLVSADVSRKIVHVSASCWLLFWPWFDASHWTWRLNITVPAVYSVVMIIKGLVIRDRNDKDVRTMCRTGDPFELCLGPLMYVAVMCVVGLYLFQTEQGVMMMAALGWGDGFAPLIGQRYGKTRYRMLGRGKSVEGSVGCFAATLFGLWFFRWVLGYPALDLPAWVAVAAVGTVVEAVSPSDVDNLLIPLAVFYAAPYARTLSRYL